MTRPIAPGTSISRLHKRGTWPKPSSRAATAGNCAFRSSVTVKMTETKLSGRRSFRAMSSETSSRVAARMESSSLASACAAPLIAHNRSVIATRILPKRLHLIGAEPAGLPLGEPFEPERAEADALERDDVVAHGLGHPADLSISPLLEGDLDAALSRAAHARLAGEAVFELDPIAQASKLGLGRRLSERCAIGALDAVARMRQPVRKLAVVGQEDEPGRVGVEPPHRVEPPARRHEVRHRLALPWLAGSRDH